jgi:hypothetical protein
MFFQRSSRKEIERGLKPLFPRIWRYCLALTGNKDAADDLAQTVCLRALEKASPHFDIGRLHTCTAIICFVWEFLAKANHHIAHGLCA